MNDSDIQVIVQEVMRRMFGENGSAANGTAPSPASATPSSASANGAGSTATVSSVVTRNDIAEFIKDGKKRLLIQRGGLITPLARDMATENGLEIVWATEEEQNGKNGASQPASASNQADQTALACLRCNSCLEPVFYERALKEMEGTTARVLGELRTFIQRGWLREPADIRQLRTLSRPPMGNLPCCFYANFNLFWAGENLQVNRQLVIDGALPVQAASLAIAGLLERHANRLEKWSMTETVALERMLVQYFRGKGPANQEEFLAVVEHAMLALDRVQSWVDGLLPWNELDRHLALRAPIAVL